MNILYAFLVLGVMGAVFGCVLAVASKVFAVEMNMGRYVNEITRVVNGKCPVVPITKNRGQIHTSAEILREIKEEVK